MSNSLQGCKALVVGVANEHSIAWGIAMALREAGAELALTFLNAKAEPFVRPLAERVGTAIFMPLDVAQPEQQQALFDQIGKTWGKLDILVHCIAFAPRGDLQGRVIDTTAEGFGVAMDVSVHSFARLCRSAEPLMAEGGACMTVSFYGAEKVISTYNMMGPVKAALEAAARELASELGPNGITVNVLSPGTIATRAAGGIASFDAMLEQARERAPMKRLATIENVGATAAFLASPAARAITGETIHVDGGYHIMG
ncbi:MAG: Enoyl-[acyl-carrier-protein] reductase [Hyphomicrobiales bacterium]|nr:Enoyl-[acyl-carrier-protein] reductase [Hyphomicrobiales bacterium]